MFPLRWSVIIPDENERRSSQSGRFNQSKSSLPRFIFAGHRSPLARKKFIFPKQFPSRGLLVHPVACFDRIMARLNLLWLQSFSLELWSRRFTTQCARAIEKFGGFGPC